MRYYIGLDLGGTAIKGGVLDENLEVIADSAIDTESAGGAEHVIARMAELARVLARDAKLSASDVRGVGVGTPGPIDPKTHIVLEAPNLGWKNVALGARMQKLLGWPIAVVNDANAACYGEFIAGIGRQLAVTDMVMLTLGTGVGGGIVIDGKLFVGPHGAGAELGHTIVTVNGRPCGCGQRGCIEAYASASAMMREARRRLEAGEKSSLPPSPSTKDLFDAAGVGDAVARAVIDEACEYLGAGIVNFIHAVDPQLVVLGGGVTAAGESLLQRVRDAFDRHAWKASPAYARIELATLGNDAGFIGAASLAKTAPMATA
jgi:glucokinase